MDAIDEQLRSTPSKASREVESVREERGRPERFVRDPRPDRRDLQDRPDPRPDSRPDSRGPRMARGSADEQQALREFTRLGIRSARKLATDNPSKARHEILREFREKKKELNLTDEQFEVANTAFQKALMDEDYVEKGESALGLPTTNMGKALGPIVLNYSTKMKVPESDERYLKDILELHRMERDFHTKIILQSTRYRDFDLSATLGRYDDKKNDIAVHIPAVIAALFFPKFGLIDSHMVHASIAGIVRSRHEEAPFVSKSDFEVFYDLISDPSDALCDSHSTVRDLLQRAKIQSALWRVVYALRTGLYYDESANTLVDMIETCKLVDEPNYIVYGNDASTLLRKLLNTFSLRPIVIGTNRSVNPLVDKLSTFPTPGEMPDISTLPFLNVQLGKLHDANETPINLADAVLQNKVFTDDNKVVSQEVLYARELLIIHVNRKAQYPAHPQQHDNNNYYTYNFNMMPIGLDGFQRINTRPVEVPTFITLNNGHRYRLVSVVLDEINSSIGPQHPFNNIVIGSSAMFMKHAAPEVDAGTEQFFYYNPIGVTEVKTDENGMPVRNEPFGMINGYDGDNQDISFYYEVSTRGTIFFYQLDKTSLDSPA